MSADMKRLSDRNFGLVFAGFFAILFAAVWAIFGTRLDWAAVLAVLFLAAALAFPGLLLPLNRLWMAFAAKVGHFNNHLVLGLFFYLIVFPAGALMRLLGSDPMARRRQPDAATYWQPVRRNPDRENFNDMF